MFRTTKQNNGNCTYTDGPARYRQASSKPSQKLERSYAYSNPRCALSGTYRFNQSYGIHFIITLPHFTVFNFCTQSFEQATSMRTGIPPRLLPPLAPGQDCVAGARPAPRSPRLRAQAPQPGNHGCRPSLALSLKMPGNKGTKGVRRTGDG